MKDVVMPWIINGKDEMPDIPMPNKKAAEDSVIRSSIPELINDELSKMQTQASSKQAADEGGTVFLFWHDESLSTEEQTYAYSGLPLRTHVYLAKFFDFSNKNGLKAALKEVYMYILQRDIMEKSGDKNILGRYSVIIGNVVNMDEILNFNV